MNEIMSIVDKKRFTKEEQAGNEVVFTLIWFIIQVIIIPIIYKNNAAINEINLINLVCIIGLSYYVVKQIFFSETDGVGAILGTAVLSVVWMFCLLIGGKIISGYTETLTYDKLMQNIELEMTIMSIHLVVLTLLAIVNAVQQYIQDKSMTLKTSQTQQKL